MCGPVCSVAPETLRGESQTSAIDWWSFGTALFEMVTGDSPWGSSEGEDTVLLKNISAHTFGAIEVPEGTHHKRSNLLASCKPTSVPFWVPLPSGSFHGLRKAHQRAVAPKAIGATSRPGGAESPMVCSGVMEAIARCRVAFPLCGFGARVPQSVNT
jgi:serine/threonine protein kinase